MSQETEDALEAALKAHYSQETNGGLLTDWSLVMYGVGMVTDRPAEYIFGNSHTPVHALMGLAEMNHEYQSGRQYGVDEDE